METVEFAGLELETEPGIVMTPRSTSVALVECALEHVGDRRAVVVDVGTGSGAIAVAIARSAPAATVWATDVCADSVALAGRNAARCGVDVRVRRGDLLDPVPGPIDVVVANLPYLPYAERSLHPDLAGEPSDSVYAPGDGLGPYRRLLAAARTRLAPDGLLALQFRGELVSASAAELPALDLFFAERAA
ncbi:MAG TPA: methyltransferase [Gaiellaceae bacterium]|nr:methyltransferase [Gaiellaceae bacterium]